MDCDFNKLGHTHVFLSLVSDSPSCLRHYSVLLKKVVVSARDNQNVLDYSVGGLTAGEVEALAPLACDSGNDAQILTLGPSGMYSA